MTTAITPYILIFSALLASIMATWNILSSRQTARTKATLDLILSHQESSYRDVLAKDFHSYRGKSESMVALVEGKHSAMTSARAKILEYLNYYEAICIGFDHDILDQQFYKQHWKTAFIRDYDVAEKFIVKLRFVAENDNIYEAFSRYAEDWKKGKLHIKPTPKWKNPKFVFPTSIIFAFLLFSIWA